jgi:hypothetical protein
LPWPPRGARRPLSSHIFEPLAPYLTHNERLLDDRVSPHTIIKWHE